MIVIPPCFAHIIAKSKMPVGIFIDKNLEEINQVFMPVFSKEDAFLIDYAKKLTTEKNFTEAIKQQIYALEDISEFLSEDLRYKENQIEKMK